MKNIKLISLLLILLIFKTYSEDVAVITAQGGEAFWNEVHDGAIQAGKDYGLSIFIRRSSNQNGDLAQDRAITASVENGCKVIIIAPINEKQKDIINKYNKMGIPTILIDREIEAERTQVIKTDNYQMGKKAAYEMAKVLKPGSKVAILRLEKSVTTTTQREEGFIEGAKEKGLIISLDSYIGIEVRDTRINSYNILKNIKNIDGIFTPNESAAMGVIATLRDLGLSRKIIHICVDLSDYIKGAILENELYGTFIQKPYDMGYIGVENAYRLINGDKIKEFIEIDSVFVTRTDLEK